MRQHNGRQPRGHAAAFGHSHANERCPAIERGPVIKRWPVIERAVCKQETQKGNIGIWQVLYLARRGACDRRKTEDIQTEQIRSCREVKALCEIPDNCCE